MNPLIKMIASVCTITFILYACLSHNGGLIFSHSLAAVGLLMIGYGLFASQREAETAKKVPVAESVNKQR
ncbi:hypothetical protein [Poriferisphaera sp. WC338]|uniref:hypothetical protein n=1 Tax=Poriferisphaera sp. WC338 TaxID=3425129 RepID=UPI003D81AD6C